MGRWTKAVERGDGAATGRRRRAPYRTMVAAVLAAGSLAVPWQGGAAQAATVAKPAASADIVFNGGITTGRATATSASVPLTQPSGAHVGDLLVASFTVDLAPEITPPDGWTVIATLRPSGASLFAYYHVVTGMDVGSIRSWTWTLSTAAKWSGGMSLYVGVDPTHPLDSSVKAATASGASSVTVGAVTVATVGALVIGAAGADSGKVTLAPPDGWDADWDTTTGQASILAHQSAPVPGAQGSTTWRLSKAVPSAAWTVALRPRQS